MTSDQLSAACRENDLRADLGGFPSAAKSLGVDPEDLLYIAEQRAMRLVMKRWGIEIPTVKREIQFNSLQLEEIKLLTAASADGIAIGLRAAHAWCLEHLK